MNPKYNYKSEILFIVKKRELVDKNPNSWNYSYSNTNSSGLYNSIKFVNDMLCNLGYVSHVVQVNDNNDIDREVVKYRPKIVIIEALWVVPEKFDVLIPLHPDVQWIVRLHSEVPFIATEGIAMKWIFKYAENYPTLKLAANSKRMCEEVSELIKLPVIYAPNYYPVDVNYTKTKQFKQNRIDISCFGAIRPLKNHLMQALAAIQFAEEVDKKLYFHINATRIEGKADPILKNIIELFEGQQYHELVQHSWMPHEQFIDVIKNEIDIGMQVSFTETYNIVAADHINNNIPIISSNEIEFVSKLFKANPTSSDGIVCALWRAYLLKDFGATINKHKLLKNSNASSYQWRRVLSLLLKNPK